MDSGNYSLDIFHRINSRSADQHPSIDLVLMLVHDRPLVHRQNDFADEGSSKHCVVNCWPGTGTSPW